MPSLKVQRPWDRTLYSVTKKFEQKSDKSVLKEYLNSCISRINPHPLFIILVHCFLIFFLELPLFVLKVVILQQES